MTTPKADKKRPGPSTSERQQYSPPRLIEYGLLGEVIRGSSSGVGDFPKAGKGGT